MRAAPWVVAGIGLGVVAIACVVENVTPVAPDLPPRQVVVVVREASAPAAPLPPVAAAIGSMTLEPAEAAAPPSVSPEASPTEGGTASAESSGVTTTTSASPSVSSDGGDFYACQVDADRIAVHKVGCCNHGDKEAVNAQKAAAYAASFVCTERPVCAQFIRRDTRVASCNASAHHCEMVRRP